jgi:DNA-binding NarL/FixJ family response regulator
MAIKLVIADEQEIARAGLRNLLEGTDIRIVGQAQTGSHIVEMADKHRPQVLLMEVRFSDTDPLQVIGRLKAELPEIRVLVFSALDNPRYIARTAALGADGFVDKTATKGELVKAIRTAASGVPIWTRHDLRRVGAAMASPPGSETFEVSLTPREVDVLKLIVEGATNEQIAEKLRLSYETVKEQVQVMLKKIGVVDRTQAAVWAVRKGIVR